MRNLLYYPSFEIRDIDWLKFALLSFKDIQTIIPYEVQAEVSDNYLKLEDLGFYSRIESIEYKVKQVATEKAIKCVDHILSNSEEYFHIFKTVELKSNWQSSETWNIELCSDKFHGNWTRYILGHKLGEESKNGIILNEKLSHVYMSTLSHILADYNEQPCVTDNQLMDEAVIEIRSNYLKQNQTIVEEQNILRDIVNHQIPKELHKIPLDKIIKFRFDKTNNELINHLIDNYISYSNAREKGKSGREFLKEIEITQKDYVELLKIAGMDTMHFAIVVYLSLQDLDLDTIEFLLSTISGEKAIRNRKSVNKTWEGISSKRKSQQYLANLKELK